MAHKFHMKYIKRTPHIYTWTVTPISFQTTALDKGSRYFQGRGAAPLTLPEENDNEMF